MNTTRIAREMAQSREQAYEGPESICASDLASIAAKLGVKFHEIYVSPGTAERIRISVPVSVPIRDRPMGERA